MKSRETFVEVECKNCKKKFNKVSFRYKESIKLNYSFFCDKNCANQFKTKKTVLNCTQCDKSIEISRSSLKRSKNKRFFCSHTCSAKYNNKIRGLRTDEDKKKIRDGVIKFYSLRGKKYIHISCPVCNKTFIKANNRKVCCSKNCYYIYKFGKMPYTKEDVLNLIIKIKNKISRTPQKRDCEHKLYHAAVRFFGTWNKAMKECGLRPNHSKYQKIRLRCKDGHVSDSISEKIIDDWLFENKIKHEKNKAYPNSKMHCDFYFTDYDLWVEYFGLYGGNIEEYDNTISIKEKIAIDNNFNFISLKPSVLYGDKNRSYSEKLNDIFSKYIST